MSLITTESGLEELPVGAVIVDAHGVAAQKLMKNYADRAPLITWGSAGFSADKTVSLPARLLDTPHP